MLAKQFAVDVVREVSDQPDFNVAPRRVISVVRESVDDAGALVRVLQGMRWGLVPSWAKDLSVGDRMINARSETLAEKPSYKRAFATRRCIIPADAFYEWQKLPGQSRKQPMCIRRRDGQPMAFAGLYERWRDPDAPEDAESLMSTTIITGPPNELVAPIHDRMPVALPEAAWGEWLDPNDHDLHAVQSLLVPPPAGDFEAYPVSTRVNAVRDHDAGLVEPLPDDPQATLLG